MDLTTASRLALKADGSRISSSSSFFGLAAAFAACRVVCVCVCVCVWNESMNKPINQ